MFLLIQDHPSRVADLTLTMYCSFIGQMGRSILPNTGPGDMTRQTPNLTLTRVKSHCYTYLVQYCTRLVASQDVQAG